MKISIQQPECFPWLGYFDKIMQVDKIVFLDNVQFKKRYFENRNKIRTYNGWLWLNIPVLTKGKYLQQIKDVKIDNSHLWQKKIISSIVHNYKKAPFWDYIGEDIIDLINKPYNLLVDFNITVILFLIEKLKIKKEFCLASNFNIDSNGSKLILDICKKNNADIYLSGKDGKNYLSEKDFLECFIKIDYQDFKHPVYKQFHGAFEPCMSIIDLMFNYGKKALNILGNENETIKDSIG